MEMKHCLFFLFAVVALGFSARAQILENAEEAFRVAQETGKPVLLVFSGSDWCAPCVRFSREVLTHPSFLDFAADHLVVLKSDFPQRKTLLSSLRRQNEALAERYNPDGQFPYLLLLGPDGSILSHLSYQYQQAEAFISLLSDQFAE